MKENIIALSNSYFIGSEHSAAELAKEMLSKYTDKIETDLTGSIFAYIDNKSKKTVLIEAHIDEIGLTVTNVLDGGFIRAEKVGGVDIRTLPATMVTIHGKQEVKGVFTSTPPHLAKGKNDEFSSLDELLIDTGDTDIKDKVSIGDFITFDMKAKDLQNRYITGKCLDDRAGCSALIEVAKKIKENGEAKKNVIILLASGEELGNRGARIGAFNKNVDSAIAVDVSFGLSPNAPPEHCGKCGDGAMIGLSPVLNKNLTNELIDIAKNNNIKYQYEAMAGLTSTDADVISITQSGIPSALISIPLKYMHTPIETVCLDDVKTVADIIYGYICKGE